MVLSVEKGEVPEVRRRQAAELFVQCAAVLAPGEEARRLPLVFLAREPKAIHDVANDPVNAEPNQRVMGAHEAPAAGLSWQSGSLTRSIR